MIKNSNETIGFGPGKCLHRTCGRSAPREKQSVADAAVHDRPTDMHVGTEYVCVHSEKWLITQQHDLESNWYLRIWSQ